MKNILITFILIIGFFGRSNAQASFDKMYGGIGAGVNYFNETNQVNGHMLGAVKSYVELGYQVNPKLGVGVDLGYSRGLGEVRGLLNFRPIKMNRYLISTKYKLFDSKFSPFVKLSAGLTHIEEPDYTFEFTPVDGAIRYGIGGSVEFGFTLHGVFISYSYDSYGKTPTNSTFNERYSDVAINGHALQLGYIYSL